MSKPESIKIDDVEYVRADKLDEAKKYEGEIKIVVLDRGFVYIGRVEETDNFVVIRNASNIRIWGTSRGLGELVNGPLTNTKLDKVGTVRAPTRALISMIDVEQSKWDKL